MVHFCDVPEVNALLLQATPCQMLSKTDSGKLQTANCKSVVAHVDIDLMAISITLSSTGTFLEQCSFIHKMLNIMGSTKMLTTFLPSTYHEEVGKVMNIKGHLLNSIWRKCLHNGRM